MPLIYIVDDEPNIRQLAALAMAMQRWNVKLLPMAKSLCRPSIGEFPMR